MEIDDEKSSNSVTKESQEMKKARINKWLDLRKLINTQIENQPIESIAVGRVERTRNPQSNSNDSSDAESSVLDLNSED